MPVETTSLHQKVVLWAAEGSDNFGNPAVNATGVEILVKWNQVKSESIEVQGRNVAVDSELVVDRDIANGSVIWLGGLDDIPGTSGYPPSNLLTVVRFSKVGDIKGQEFYRTVSLARLSNTFPPTA